MAAVVLLSVSFTACKKNEDSGSGGGYQITAYVENGISSIATVKALLDGTTLATAKYSNDSFSISLPVPGSQHLEEIEDGFNGCFLDGFYAYDGSGNMLGLILYGKMEGDFMTLGEYVYADSDFEFHGSEDGVTVDVSGKKGWNLFYMISDDPDFETGTLTTQKQSNMLWIFASGSSVASSKLHSAVSMGLKFMKIKQIENK